MITAIGLAVTIYAMIRLIQIPLIHPDLSNPRQLTLTITSCAGAIAIMYCMFAILSSAEKFDRVIR